MFTFTNWRNLSLGVNMEQIVFMILQLTGFSVFTSHPNIYYFIGENKTWQDAQTYCLTEYITLAEIHSQENLTAIMSTPAHGYQNKAWIGLSKSPQWLYVDGQLGTFFLWDYGQPDNINECVIIDTIGLWGTVSCSDTRPSICSDGIDYIIVSQQMTWSEAVINCQSQGLTLAKIPDLMTNGIIYSKISLAWTWNLWIGLRKMKNWHWSNSPNYVFLNWEQGQPDNLNGAEDCAAMSMKDGTWADEQCSTANPFFCYGMYKLLTRVVRMKIRTSADMDNPTSSANLQQQLHAAFANKGFTDFKITWKKLPEKQTNIPS